MTNEIEFRQFRAKEAQAQQQADAWNRGIAVGSKVTYLKSELEGKVILKTVRPAYVLGGEPVVDLEHIGIALLSKVERFFR